MLTYRERTTKEKVSLLPLIEKYTVAPINIQAHLKVD